MPSKWSKRDSGGRRVGYRHWMAWARPMKPATAPNAAGSVRLMAAPSATPMASPQRPFSWTWRPEVQDLFLACELDQLGIFETPAQPQRRFDVPKRRRQRVIPGSQTDTLRRRDRPHRHVNSVVVP